MSPVKILHIANTDWFVRHLLLAQLRALQDEGYEVVAAAPPGADAKAVEAAGVRFLPVPMTRTFTPGADLVALWRLYRLMRREAFTVVHCHNPKPGLLGQLAARLARVPVVVNTLHGFYFHEHTRPAWRRFYITTERIAARCSDIILSQSREDIHTALRERICSRQRIKHLGNGIDVRRFDRAAVDGKRLGRTRDELRLPAGVPVVGFVGRLVAEKGIREFLAAARQVRLRFPECRFLLIGPVDREKPDALTPAVAREYGLEEACLFVGMRHDLPELYALMDIFVLPSHREGLPRVLIEAAAMGLPCVATDIRGCREVVAPGRSGLLVPPRDAGALARAISALLAAPDWAGVLGREGRRIARERFDERGVFARIKAEYARLVRPNGHPVLQPVLLT
jgi:glycosyltransferase involved in cell wall biosynthesis